MSIEKLGQTFLDKVDAQITNEGTSTETPNDGLVTTGDVGVPIKQIAEKLDETIDSLQDVNVSIGNLASDGSLNGRGVYIGQNAGRNSTGLMEHFVGVNAGLNQSGNNTSGFGQLTMSGNTGNDSCGFGNASGNIQTGDRFTGIGNSSGFRNAANDTTAIGYHAGSFAVDGVVNTFSNVSQIGALSKATKNNQVVLGNVNTDEVFSTGTYVGVAFTVTSDLRLKYDVVGTGIFKNINGVQVEIKTFKRISNGKQDVGYIAQEVESALSGLSQDLIDQIITKGDGVDYAATLLAINTDLGTSYTNLKEVEPNVLTEKSLRDNGFPTISPDNARLEYAELQSKKDLSNQEQDRLDRFKQTNLLGSPNYYNVIVADIRGIDLNKLQMIIL